jgi:hypothetical protein
MVALDNSNTYLFFQLPGELDIAKVHEILLCDVGIKVLFIVSEGIK